jgi:hypothetical protein
MIRLNRIMISSLCFSMTSGQTLRVCPEGKPVPTFPGHAPVLTVMFRVMAAGLGMMFLGVAGMPVGAMGVVRRLLVIAGLMVLGGFAVMLRCLLMVFGGLVMVLDVCVVSHISLPVQCEGSVRSTQVA